MKLKTDVFSNNDVNSTTATKKMGFAEGSESMQFKAFTEYIYSNPIGSLVREITSNCFDSHVEAGVENTPVLIKKIFDKQTDTHYISFIDYGVGLSKQQIEDIYMNYFASTKRDSNEVIGGWGLGSKTPLAYKRYTGEGDNEYDNSFFVITNYNGIKYYYTVFEGTKSPEYNLFHEEETTERNGTEIRIPVLERDVYKFEEELLRQLYYFEGIVFEGFSDIVENNYQIVKGKNFLYRGDDVDNHMHVCLGKVYYPIDYNVLGLDSYDYRLPIAINVPIGKVGVTLSRENLDYSEQTIKYLKKRIDDTISELKTMLEDQYSNIVTLEDYFKLKNNFGVLELTENKSIRLSNFISQKDVDLSKFKYSEFKTPNSAVLFELFFKVRTYGKKESRYSWNDRNHTFKRDYDGIVMADNVFYSDSKELKLKRVKQSYLKNQFGRFYMVFRKDIVENWDEICDHFRLHFDTKDDFIKSKSYKNLLKMQEEYYDIVRKNSKEYESFEVPEDFKLNYGRTKLTSDILKTTIPVKIDNYDKERIKIQDLVDFNGKIFYGTPNDEYLAKTCRNLFRDFWGGQHLADDYSHWHTGRKFGDKKGIMIITVAKNNLKYFKYCNNAYPISQFYTKIVRRKEDVIVKQLRNEGIRDKYMSISEFYKSDLFKSLSPIWENRVEKIVDFIDNIKSNNVYNVRQYRDWLRNHIDDSKFENTAEEKTVSKHIDSLLKLQSNNRDSFRFINVPYNVNTLDSDDMEILTKLLKTVLSF